jgi:hypothetical protein
MRQTKKWVSLGLVFLSVVAVVAFAAGCGSKTTDTAATTVGEYDIDQDQRRQGGERRALAAVGDVRN